MMKSQIEAEELLQKSFIDVFLKIDGFRFESSPGAWIKRIVINNCINELKKKKLSIVELDSKAYQLSEKVEEPPKGLDMMIVKEALNELPDGYRMVFSLYLIEGYNHQEIAQILNITEATSKSQYSRAKNRMKAIIKDKMKEA